MFVDIVDSWNWALCLGFRIPRCLELEAHGKGIENLGLGCGFGDSIIGSWNLGPQCTGHKLEVWFKVGVSGLDLVVWV